MHSQRLMALLPGSGQTLAASMLIALIKQRVNPLPLIVSHYMHRTVKQWQTQHSFQQGESVNIVCAVIDLLGVIPLS